MTKDESIIPAKYQASSEAWTSSKLC